MFAYRLSMRTCTGWRENSCVNRVSGHMNIVSLSATRRVVEDVHERCWQPRRPLRSSALADRGGRGRGCASGCTSSSPSMATASTPHPRSLRQTPLVPHSQPLSLISWHSPSHIVRQAPILSFFLSISPLVFTPFSTLLILSLFLYLVPLSHSRAQMHMRTRYVFSISYFV